MLIAVHEELSQYGLTLFNLFCCLIQKHQGQNNRKTATETYNLEPPGDRTHALCSPFGQSIHPSAFGSSRNMTTCSSHYENGEELGTRESYTHRAASQFSRFSSSVAFRGASLFGGVLETAVNPHWSKERINASASSEKHVCSHHLQDRPISYQLTIFFKDIHFRILHSLWI